MTCLHNYYIDSLEWSHSITLIGYLCVKEKICELNAYFGRVCIFPVCLSSDPVDCDLVKYFLFYQEIGLTSPFVLLKNWM
jgi:hypothetical protein